MGTAVLRYVEREARVYRRLWRGSAFSQFLQPSLYLAAMGIGLGGLIGSGTQQTVGTQLDGISYLQFVAPGLLAATVMQSSAAESLWPVMGGMKWLRNYHAMVATPIRPGEVYAGNLAWMSIRMTMSASAFLAVAALLGALHSPLAVLAVPAGVLGGVAVASILSAFSATQETDARFPLVMRFAILPMFLFSGTFFPVDQLPSAIQAVAWASPLWHSVELSRAATTGSLPPLGVVALAAHVIVLAGFTAAGWHWGARTFTERLAP